jgi:TolB-like protein
MKLIRLLSFAIIAVPAIARSQNAAADSRPTVAVMNFAGGSLTRPSAYTSLGRGLSELLTTALAARGDIRVVERDRLDAVLGEQKLVAANQVDPETAVRLGKVLGVRHIVSGGFFVDGRNRLRFDVRAVNVETSEIEFRESMEGKVDDLLSLIDRMEERVSKSLGLSSVVQAGRPRVADPARQARAKALIDSLSAKRP